MTSTRYVYNYSSDSSDSSDSSGGSYDIIEETDYASVSDGVWSAWLPEGKKVTLSVIPAEDQSVTGVLANGVPLEEEYDDGYSFTVSDHHVTITAEFGTKTYTVKWVNYDGKVLQKDKNLEYGAEHPSYDGETPTKDDNAQYTYTFIGWDKEFPATVTDDITYTAQFTETVNKYAVIWQNADGTMIETDEEVPYGTVPTFDGTIEVSDENTLYWTDGTNTYCNDDLPAVTANVTYKAVFLKVKMLALGTVFYQGDMVDFGDYYINRDDQYGYINSKNGYGLIVINKPEYYSNYSQYLISDDSSNGFWLTSPTDLGENIGIKVVGGDGSEDRPFIFNVAANETETESAFKVIFVSDGKIVADTCVANNNTVSAYSAEKDGYRLAGWLDANGNLFDFATPVTKDITLTAKWIENIVNIQFIDVNGKAKTTLKIYPVNNSFENTAQQIVIPNVPYLDGYTFTGWTLNGTSYSKDSQSNLEAALASLVETAPDDAIIVKEIYTQAETLYSVTVTGGSVRNSKDDTSGKYQASDQIYVTATGNTEGQIFSHWEKLDAGSTTPVIVGYEETYAFRMPSKDTSLTAVYQTTPEEKVGTAYIESVTVHDENKISFVSIVSVPDDATILRAGIVACKQSDLTAEHPELTIDYARFKRYNDTTCKDYKAFKYTWTKGNVNANDIWCVRAYLLYSDKDGEQYTIYGNTVKADLSGLITENS